jgi:hypothetical protein
VKRLLVAALVAAAALGPPAADARPRCADWLCDMCYEGDTLRFCL